MDDERKTSYPEVAGRDDLDALRAAICHAPQVGSRLVRCGRWWGCRQHCGDDVPMPRGLRSGEPVHPGMYQLVEASRGATDDGTPGEPTSLRLRESEETPLLAGNLAEQHVTFRHTATLPSTGQGWKTLVRSGVQTGEISPDWTPERVLSRIRVVMNSVVYVVLSALWAVAYVLCRVEADYSSRVMIGSGVTRRRLPWSKFRRPGIFATGWLAGSPRLPVLLERETYDTPYGSMTRGDPHCLSHSGVPWKGRRHATYTGCSRPQTRSSPN